MRLYTEEQLREAHQNGRHGGNNENWHDTESYINSLIPIQLPSDEEIETKIENMEGISLEIEVGYRAGAKWMRDKILNK